ncbi:MAG: DUF2269 family protein [Bauldia sp.]
MDIFLILKFLHVAAAIVWIGGGFCLVLIAIAADRRQDREEFARVLHSLILLAGSVLTPAAVIALLSGLAATWLSWGFDNLWIILGLIGFAATFLTGNIFLTPRAKRMSEIVAREGVSDGAIAIGRELVSLAKFDYVMMFVVVADMVFKPEPGDWPILSLMAIAMIAGAVLFVAPVLRTGGRSQTTLPVR